MSKNKSKDRERLNIRIVEKAEFGNLILNNEYQIEDIVEIIKTEFSIDLPEGLSREEILDLVYDKYINTIEAYRISNKQTRTIHKMKVRAQQDGELNEGLGKVTDAIRDFILERQVTSYAEIYEYISTKFYDKYGKSGRDPRTRIKNSLKSFRERHFIEVNEGFSVVKLK